MLDKQFYSLRFQITYAMQIQNDFEEMCSSVMWLTAHSSVFFMFRMQVIERETVSFNNNVFSMINKKCNLLVLHFTWFSIFTHRKNEVENFISIAQK